MNKHKILYVISDLNENKFVYSGITLDFFIKHIKQTPNMLLIKSDYIGEKCLKNFELIEGVEQIEALIKYNEKCGGDFCFVDYCSESDLACLSEYNIAELLYMGHVFKPLESPFFKEIKNDFAYLSHDDSFYCKLYCKNSNEFKSVFCANICLSLIGENENIIDEAVAEKLFMATENGIFIDFSDKQNINGKMMVPVFQLGAIEDMDCLYNNKSLKENRNLYGWLSYGNAKWELKII